MHVQIGVFWAVMLCSVVASYQTARHHITGDNVLLFMGSAARTLHFTGIYILLPLLTVLEASLKLKIANIYRLALCSFLKSSDILYSMLTYVPNCFILANENMFIPVAGRTLGILILFLVANFDFTYSWSLSSVYSSVFVSFQFIL